VEDYYRVSVIPIRGFRFFVLTYTPTHIMTVIAIWYPQAARDCVC